MSGDIDPVQFGQLLGAVTALKEDVESLTSSVDGLKSQFTGGKGIVIGLTIAAGGIGAAAHKIMEGLFHG